MARPSLVVGLAAWGPGQGGPSAPAQAQPLLEVTGVGADYGEEEVTLIDNL